MDPLLLARSAAWLCVAEQNAQVSPGPKPDALWAPILFLAMRENAAAELWQRSKPAAPSPTGGGALERWWTFLLAQPRSKDAFAFAADPANRRWAMPLLVYQTRRFDLLDALPEAMQQLFDDRASLSALHDYGPFLARHTGIGGGRMLEGGWPALSRRAWVESLRGFKPEAGDFRGYADALAQIKAPAAADRSRGQDADASVAGLAEVAPLFNLGFAEGAGGKLLPVAVATSRDLLNFGWEMNGAQMGARWHFVQKSWGVADLADAIARDALAVLDGAEFFFVAYPFGYRPSAAPEPWKHVKRARLGDVRRLQETFGELVASGRTFSADRGENARRWPSRGWLRPAFVQNQSSELLYANQPGEVTPLLRRLRAEGGPLTEQVEIRFLAYGPAPTGGTPKLPGGDELVQELLSSQPEPSAAGLKAGGDRFERMPPLQAAQEMEKLFWQRPGGDLPYNQIFSHYLRAHAYDAARRFYRQVGPFVDGRVGFSNGIGPRRFMLALLENDPAAMAEAVEASNTGSYRDMVLDIVASAARDDFPAMGAQVDDCLERYPPKSDAKDDMMVKLKGFLPLAPALRDPAHPDHGRVLDFFDRYKNWPSLQWVLAQRAKLPPEEAVRFLGGRETDPERRLLVAYLLKDKELFARTYDEFEAARLRGGPGWANMAFVLTHFLRNELLGVPVPAGLPDLRPPGAQSVRMALAARREAAAEARALEAMSKYQTADALWTRIEELRKGPSASPNSRQAVKTYLQETIAATAEFSKRYPQDARRWGAKLLGVQMADYLAQVGGDPAPDPAGVEGTLQEVAHAPDAPVEIQGEARYRLARLHLERATPEAAPAQEAEIAAFAHDYPKNPRVGELRLLLANSLAESDPVKSDVLLAGLVGDPNPRVAQEAKGRLNLREVMRKSLELKFTALDGKEVDVAKLRGKVVLIDFWATWCGPCMAEMPTVLETYKKLHGQGFEIVGISLDQDRAKVLKVTEAQGMSWPQHFDGKGWQNEISSRYAITSIPAQWLVNKRGMVVSTQARKGLAEAVEKLLAE